MSEDRCPDCGAAVAGGREGCQALFDEVITVRAYSDPRMAALRDFALDTYCMQHVDRYCRSAKSYAAHLTRLCCRLERAGSPAVLAAIRHWLDGRVSLEKPDILPHLGAVTIADARAARSADELTPLVRAWAEDVWSAYASQQNLAREWIRIALGSRD